MLNIIKKHNWFTLLELLITIGIISILAGIVIIAVNPAKQFRQANDAQRASDIRAINDSIAQYQAAHRGWIPSWLTDNPKWIKWVDASDYNINEDIDLYETLVSEGNYIADLPIDPTEGYLNSSSDYNTKYMAYVKDNVISITSPHKETEEFEGIIAKSQPLCGNGITESGENCDDANTDDNDGCSSSCQTEEWGGEEWGEEGWEWEEWGSEYTAILFVDINIINEVNNNCSSDCVESSGDDYGKIISGKEAEIASLTNLDLSWWGITNLQGIWNLTWLTNLDLDGNDFSSIPAEIQTLTNLQILRIGYNHNLTSLPSQIGNLSNLKELYIEDNNSLLTLPSEIGNLNNLEILSFLDGEITNLPSTIGNLNNLKKLDLSSNSLTSLPNEFWNLTNLENLELMQNQINTLSSWIGNLTKLTDLGLWETWLTSLPAEIGNLTNLQRLSLGRNNLISFPVAQTGMHLSRLNISYSGLNCSSTNVDTWNADECSD